MPTAKHPRTLARRAADLSLNEAAAQIGITPHALECFELDPARTLKTPLCRRRARAIYGAELVPPPPPNQPGYVSRRACACGCGKQVSRAHNENTKPGADRKLRFPGKRFYSYACRKRYAAQFVERAQRELRQRQRAEKPKSERNLRSETVAINALVSANAPRPNAPGVPTRHRI